VVANGPPAAPYTLSDGRRIVEWQESFGVPSPSYSSGFVGGGF
jgi:aminopeptidase N